MNVTEAEMVVPIMVFNWLEYLVFIAMLSFSALIGVYFGFCKGGQNTVDGYLLGGKEMGVFPMSMSLTSSFISGITILGIPTEVYTTGLQYAAAIFCFFTVGTIFMYGFLPVFYELQALSLYEYMELRFNRKVRKLVSFLYTINLLCYIPVVIYGPALALNQVSGLNIHLISITVCVVCIFYTSIGGLKAVVWTDTLQGAVMYLACLAVAVIGTIKVGGLSALIQAAKAGDRFDIFDDLDFSPLKRLTFWTVFIGQTINWTANTSVSPASIQRFVALSTMSKARKTVVLMNLGCLLFFSVSCYMGLVVYTKYQGCDPIASGSIKRADQILPYFILDVLGDVRGLPGLFLAGVVCAALSTMSACLNTVAGTLYEDFIEPTFGKTTEYRASVTLKILVAVVGSVCIALVLVIERLGSLIELSLALSGLTTGSNLGIFILGLFLPQANSMGALVGGLGSLAVMSTILIGSRRAIARGDIVYPTKPIRIDECPFNITNFNVTLAGGPVSGEVFPLFEISVFYYTLIGVTVVVLLGLTVSYITGANKVVDRSLLIPIVRRLYEPVSVKEEDKSEIDMTNGKMPAKA